MSIVMSISTTASQFFYLRLCNKDDKTKNSHIDLFIHKYNTLDYRQLP